MRILLIEDDEILADILTKSLIHQRYAVETATDGQMGWEYAQSTHYDLILLDVGLPKLNGIELCQRLRAEGCASPILLMTAQDASSDRIRGLDAGADDYLTKPLDLGELQARVRALLRRGEVLPTPVLEIGPLKLDPSSCQVSYGQQLLPLTPKEYSLLELLMRNPTRVFSRGQIIEHLWTFDDPPQEDSVKAHIKGLRHKLKQAGAADWIENVYGLGYRLMPQLPAETVSASQPPSQKVPQPSSTTASIRPTAGLSIEQQYTETTNALWLQYQDLMAQRLSVLQAAVFAAPVGLSPTLRQSAEQAAHKLAGVLGMFERDAGSELARQIERLCQQEVLASDQIQQLTTLVTQLVNLLDLQPGQTATESPQSAQLLLIDPDAQMGSELQQLARSLNLTCAQVTTVKQARNWLQTTSPDLVVLSLDRAEQLQIGLALSSELAARTPAIPVLVLAGAPEEIDRITVARAGGRGFLVKPVTAAQVWDLSTQLLQQARQQAIKVLVVDDDPAFLGALQPMLEPWGMRMVGLSDPQQFWQTLQATTPDLLILDVEMPHVNGIELCQAVRTDPEWQALPILFLTAHHEAEMLQQGFAAGADDYVTKPVMGPELLTRITNRLERTRLLENFSHKDPLTGLLNQPQSSRELAALLSRTAAHPKHFPLSLVLLQTPQLQSVNLQYGHASGNQVLQRWGTLLQHALDGAEVLGYWGYGEFILGLPGLTQAQTQERLSELLITLRQQVFTTAAGERFQVGCHWGIAQAPEDGLTLQSLYQIAHAELSQVVSAPEVEDGYR